MATTSKKTTNPFVVQGYMGAEYFCNRTTETEIIKRSIENGLNVTLISGRRKGKSNLIQHIFAQLKSPSICVDIFHIQSFDQFAKLLTEEVLRQYGKPKQDFIKRATGFLKNFQPVLGYDSISGEPQLSVVPLKSDQGMQSLNELFQFLENENKTITLAIDEFQEICNWTDNAGEAALRTLIQQHPSIRFIFSGSDRQLMSELFTKSKRPFYRSAELIYLNKIEKATYEKFILQKFKKANRTIDSNIINSTLEWCRGETYYIQRIFNRVYSSNIEVNTQNLIQLQQDYLNEKESEFQVQLNLVSKKQQELLFALSKENGTTQPTATDFIKKHNLSSSSTVSQNLTSLISKDLVEQEDKTYFVSDVFFARWMEGF